MESFERVFPFINENIKAIQPVAEMSVTVLIEWIQGREYTERQNISTVSLLDS